MGDSYSEFGLPLAIFIPFSAVPKDQPDRIDREERLVRTIENLGRHQNAVRDNIIYLGSLRKEGILQDSLEPPKVHPRVVAAQKEAFDAEVNEILENVNAPAEPGKTLADFDSTPDAFPKIERPVTDVDIEMGDAGESLEESVQRMISEAIEADKNPIMEDHGNQKGQEFAPIDAFYRKKAMDRLKAENEERLAQRTLEELKIADWASPGRRLERLVEAAVMELEGRASCSKTPFFQEALIRERTRNEGIGVRVVQRFPASTLPAPTNAVHILPAPNKPVLAAAPPYDSVRAHSGNVSAIVSSPFPTMSGAAGMDGGPANGLWIQNGGAHNITAAQLNETTPAERKSVELNGEEKWLLEAKEFNLPWKVIAKRWGEQFRRPKNEAALQMQFKRLRDRMNGGTILGAMPMDTATTPSDSPGHYNIQHNHAYAYGPAGGMQQPPGQIAAGPQRNDTLMTQAPPPPIQPQLQPKTITLPSPETQQQTQLAPSVPGWTAINKPSRMPLPSNSLPPDTAQQPAVSNSSQYRPPPFSSLAPDHPNFKNLQILHAHSPLSGAMMELEFIAMKTVLFSTNKVLAVREGERILIMRYAKDNTFMGANSKGFLAAVSDDVLWSDNRSMENTRTIAPNYQPQPQEISAKQTTPKPPWSEFYVPPPISKDHPNISVLQLLTEKHIRPGEGVEFTFTAMKAVPLRSNYPRFLAMRQGEIITVIEYLHDKEFRAKNHKGFIARITDEVVWGENNGEERANKVPNSPLEKSSILHVPSDTSVPAGSKSPLDISVRNMVPWQMISSGPEASQQPLPILPSETRVSTVPEDKAYEPPMQINADHPNQGIYDFLRHLPPLLRGARIMKDAVAMTTVMLKKENSLHTIREGDIIEVVEYSHERSFLVRKGNMNGLVDDDILWGAPCADLEVRNESEIAGSDNGVAVDQVEEPQNATEKSNPMENMDVNALHVDYLVNQTWRPGQVVNLEVLAVRSWELGEGKSQENSDRLVVAKGDIVRVLKCLLHEGSSPVFLGRNLRTAEEGQVNTALFRRGLRKPGQRKRIQAGQEGDQSPESESESGSSVLPATEGKIVPSAAINTAIQPEPTPYSPLVETPTRRGGQYQSLIKGHTPVPSVPPVTPVAAVLGGVTASLLKDPPSAYGEVVMDTDADATTNLDTLQSEDSLKSQDTSKAAPDIGLDFVALVDAAGGSSNLSVRSGDRIRIRRYRGRGTFLAKHLGTGSEGKALRGTFIDPDSIRTFTDKHIQNLKSPQSTKAYDAVVHQTNLDILYSRDWHKSDTIGLDFMALQSVKESTRKLGVVKGDEVRITSFLGGSIYLARNQRTGKEGELWVGILKDDFLIRNSEEVEVEAEEDATEVKESKERSSTAPIKKGEKPPGPSGANNVPVGPAKARLGSPGPIESQQRLGRDVVGKKRKRTESPSPNERGLNKLFSKVWKQYERVEPPITLTALHPVPPGAGRLAVRRGDEVRLLTNVIELCFIGVNTATNERGEVEVSVFVDDGDTDRDERGSGGGGVGRKRARGASLERVRDVEWSAREKQVRERHEGERNPSIDNSPMQLVERTRRGFDEERKRKEEHQELEERGKRKSLEAQKKALDDELDVISRQKQLEATRRKLDAFSRQKQLEEETRRKEVEETRLTEPDEARQRQRQLEEAVQEQISNSLPEPDKLQQQDHHQHEQLRLEVPSDVTSGPRSNVIRDQPTIKALLASTAYTQGEALSIHVIAKKSTRGTRSGQLAVIEGDGVHITKFVSGGWFAGVNMTTNAKGQVFKDTFFEIIPGQIVDIRAVAKKTVHAINANQLSFNEGDEVHITKFISGTTFLGVNRAGAKGQIYKNAFREVREQSQTDEGARSKPIPTAPRSSLDPGFRNPPLGLMTKDLSIKGMAKRVRSMGSENCSPVSNDQTGGPLDIGGSESRGGSPGRFRGNSGSKGGSPGRIGDYEIGVNRGVDDNVSSQSRRRGRGRGRGKGRARGRGNGSPGGSLSGSGMIGNYEVDVLPLKGRHMRGPRRR